MRELLKVMKALSDPGRIKALKILEGGELCVCRVQEALELSQPTVSKHLRQMEDAGLVQSRKQGPWVYYRLHENPPTPYAAALLRHLRDWLAGNADLGRALELLAASYEHIPADPACPSRCK